MGKYKNTLHCLTTGPGALVPPWLPCTPLTLVHVDLSARCTEVTGVSFGVGLPIASIAYCLALVLNVTRVSCV